MRRWHMPGTAVSVLSVVQGRLLLCAVAWGAAGGSVWAEDSGDTSWGRDLWFSGERSLGATVVGH